MISTRFELFKRGFCNQFMLTKIMNENPPERERERNSSPERDRERERVRKPHSHSLKHTHSRHALRERENKIKAAFALSENTSKRSSGFSTLKSKGRGKGKDRGKDSVAARQRALRVCALISLAFFVRSLLWLSFALRWPKAALAAPQQLTTIAIVKANARPDGATSIAEAAAAAQQQQLQY